MDIIARVPFDFFLARRLALIARRDDLRIAILSNREMSADAAYRLITIDRVLLGQVPPQWAAFTG